jgi:amidophosphoribosyltransferase
MQVVCRDKNRIAAQADIVGAQMHGVTTFCALTGDDVTAGDEPEARRVFDIDGPQLVSIMNGISVYEARLRLGDKLADTIARYAPTDNIDVVMPIPDSARPAAMQVARKLGIEYREGFYKNKYIGRTFIMPGQAHRTKSVRQKLNAMSSEFAGKNVLIVDDSIVRGTTSREIVEMAREAGAKSVTFTSAAPPVRFAHVYGINMPNKGELVAAGRTIPESAREIGADHLIYQEVEDMKDAIVHGSSVTELDMSCFTGEYVTGTVSDEYLSWVETHQSS